MSTSVAHAQELCDRLATGFESGDPESALEVLAPEAVLVGRSSLRAHGPDAIARAMRLVGEVVMTADVEVQRAVDVAQVMLVWTRSTFTMGEGDNRGSEVHALEGHAVHALLDGAWKVVIAAPWGIGDDQVPERSPAS